MKYKIYQISYKTSLNEILSGYFIEHELGYLQVVVKSEEFVEIKPENIMSKKEIGINLLGRVK